jgi:S-methylmethionine-dependent homocysteine/selenocysteine methylase
MNFLECYENNKILLMEGAVGERLKQEYCLYPDEYVALAGHVYKEQSRLALKDIYGQYIQTGVKYGYPVMLTTPTRRANKDRVQSSVYNENIIRDNVDFMRQLREGYSHPVFIGGLMGCKGDAYKATERLDTREAFEFHSWQAELFREAKADYLFAGIMPSLPEAIGMAKAMEAAGLPYIISFMIRENGRLIDGTTITEAITAIDGETSRKPVCYMTNCVHPFILEKALSCPFNQSTVVRERFMGIQANASPMTPEELEGGGDIIVSNCAELAEGMAKLHKEYRLKILGGCCGTDQCYMDNIAERLAGL